MSDKELLIKELITKDFNEILVNEFCTDWKEKRFYIELLVRATHFDYLLNYIREKDIEAEKIIEEYQKALDETTSEKIDLQSIIKEVREYIEEMQVWLVGFEDFGITTKGLLEILDKGK